MGARERKRLSKKTNRTMIKYRAPYSMLKNPKVVSRVLGRPPSMVSLRMPPRPCQGEARIDTRRCPRGTLYSHGAENANLTKTAHTETIAETIASEIAKFTYSRSMVISVMPSGDATSVKPSFS